MGFGSYRRSFTLADSSCSTPGCLFAGRAAPGPCTASSGILGYYEIMALIKQKNLAPVWDKEAAVKWITFDSDQWVSYDDADTFKQKVDWADSIGAGGSLIWASDLDDDQFTAHSGLLGCHILPSVPLDELKDPRSQNLAGLVAGDSGLKCTQGINGLAQGNCGIPRYRWVGGEKGTCGSINGQVSWDCSCMAAELMLRSCGAGSEAERYVNLIKRNWPVRAFLPPFVAADQGDGEEDGEEDDEDGEEELENVEGCTDEDVGFMRLDPFAAYPGAYHYLVADGDWHLLYVRPPAVGSM